VELATVLWPVAVLFVVGVALTIWGLVRTGREDATPLQDQLAAEERAGPTPQVNLTIGGFAFLFIFLCAAIGGGLWALDIGLKSLELARASTGWPTTPGQIVSSRVIEHRQTNEDGDPHTSYWVQVRYAYMVNGISYSSERVNLGVGGGGDSPAGAQRVVSRYPAGSRATVYYDPQNPQEALLEPGEGMAVWLPLWMAGGALLAAVGLAVFLVRALLRRMERG
jgi:hypothetical protein